MVDGLQSKSCPAQQMVSGLLEKLKEVREGIEKLYRLGIGGGSVPASGRPSRVGLTSPMTPCPPKYIK